MILKRLIPILLAVPLLAACPSGNPNGKMPVDVSKLPRQIYSGEQGPFHVQGIAVDLDRGYMYFSFTTTLLKTDMQGNLLGSVEGMTGHLGCMTLNPDDGRLYASIEYKHDAIGKGILNKLEGVRNDEQTGFYVAVFDVDRIDRIGMNAEKDDVMKTVYIKEAVDDYYAKVSNNGQELEHRFGCSGIDGVTFAPAFGQSRDGKKYLYVAYGIYGDTLRTDNDYQVILAYDTRDWKRYEQPLTQENLHKSGPEKPLHKYFLYTGNTSWGIQNLAYDKASGNMHAAVYKGKKSHYPNYSYFVIDGSKAPERKQLQGFDPAVEAEVLSLLPDCQVYPFATASLRGLKNTADIVARVERETGFKIDVITGREEAILDYRGAVGRMQERSGVLVDIGGGSTELVFFRSREVIAARSLPLGSLALFNRFVSGVIPDKQELRSMRAEAMKVISAAMPPKGDFVPEPICGVGGTARAANQLYLAAGGGTEGYSPDFLRDVLAQAEANPRKLMRRILKLAPERVHTLIPGIVVLSTAAELCGAKTIVTSSYGVREGYLENMLEKEGLLHG